MKNHLQYLKLVVFYKKITREVIILKTLKKNTSNKSTLSRNIIDVKEVSFLDLL